MTNESVPRTLVRVIIPDNRYMFLIQTTTVWLWNIKPLQVPITYVGFTCIHVEKQSLCPMCSDRLVFLYVTFHGGQNHTNLCKHTLEFSQWRSVTYRVMWLKLIIFFFIVKLAGLTFRKYISKVVENSFSVSNDLIFFVLTLILYELLEEGSTINSGI